MTTPNPIVVAAAASADYVVPLAAMVRSVLVHAGAGREIALYVIDGGIGDAGRSRLLHSWQDDRLTVHWVVPDPARFGGVPLWGRMAVAAYYRLAVGHLLPEGVRKVVWLDCDLIVRKDIGELWDLGVGPHVLLAAQDMVIPYVCSRFGLARYRELGIAPETKYFNSGVMVVDLDRWRREAVLERSRDYLTDPSQQVFFVDQDGLNAVLSGQWGELDPRWNQIASVAGRAFFKPRHLEAEAYRLLVDDPWIVHFAGTLKPWVVHNESRDRALFFRYLDTTDWAGWRPRRSVAGVLLGLYETRLRNVFYRAEPLVLRLLRRWRASRA